MADGDDDDDDDCINPFKVYTIYFFYSRRRKAQTKETRQKKNIDEIYRIRHTRIKRNHLEYSASQTGPKTDV